MLWLDLLKLNDVIKKIKKLKNWLRAPETKKRAVRTVISAFIYPARLTFKAERVKSLFGINGTRVTSIFAVRNNSHEDRGISGNTRVHWSICKVVRNNNLRVWMLNTMAAILLLNPKRYLFKNIKTNSIISPISIENIMYERFLGFDESTKSIWPEKKIRAIKKIVKRLDDNPDKMFTSLIFEKICTLE